MIAWGASGRSAAAELSARRFAIACATTNIHKNACDGCGGSVDDGSVVVMAVVQSCRWSYMVIAMVLVMVVVVVCGRGCC